jgi:hypothetical protein
VKPVLLICSKQMASSAVLMNHRNYTDALHEVTLLPLVEMLLHDNR